MATTLFCNGTVIDGSGNPAVKGSVLIDGDRILAVIGGGEELPSADTIIDAVGLVIAPGFIDMHSHADWVLPAEEHPEILSCLVEQGVTSVISGNCGITPAPITLKVVDMFRDFISMIIAIPFEYEWNSMAGFLDRVQKARPIVNMAELVGHASIRLVSANTRRGAMSGEELSRCLVQARTALDDGACGLSFGLGYDPGMFSPLDELKAFCSVAEAAGKPVTVHLKALSWLSPCYPLTSFGAHNVRALEEMLEVAKETGVRLQLSHFIFAGRRSWSTVDKCIGLVEEARSSGVDVMIDAFPYTCGNTTILAPLPYWFLARLPEAYKGNLARARLKLELAVGFRLVGFLFRDFQIMDAAVPGWEGLNGLRIPEVAEKWNTSPLNAMLKLAEQSNGATVMLFHMYSGEPGNEVPLEKVLSNDLCLFETDAFTNANIYPNPASMGTFPRILGYYVRKKKMITLENAIRRMTAASAQRFGLNNIGSLQPGKAADIVLFDPKTISDNPPEGSSPPGRPKGIKHVFINGAHVVRDGVYIRGVRAGRVLRT
jgi:N-acyl-D-amino-acid deacylase